MFCAATAIKINDFLFPFCLFSALKHATLLSKLGNLRHLLFFFYWSIKGIFCFIYQFFCFLYSSLSIIMHECACCASIVALFLPPLAVLMVSGCGFEFCLNVLLTILFYIPGVIHAYWVIYSGSSKRDQIIFVQKQGYSVPPAQQSV